MKLSLLKINGKKAFDYLQGQATNDIAKAQQNGSVQTGFLDRFGRIIALVTIIAKDEEYFVELETSVKDVFIKNQELFARLSQCTIEEHSERDDEKNEQTRIQEGTPQFGKDYDHNTQMLELPEAENRYVSFTKGCFIGQEVVARMHNLGKPPRRIVGIESDSQLEIGELTFNGQTVGKITSVSGSIGLAKLSINYAKTGTELTTKDGNKVTVTKFGFD